MFSKPSSLMKLIGLIVYIDDIIVMDDDVEEIKNLKTLLKSRTWEL